MMQVLIVDLRSATFTSKIIVSEYVALFGANVASFATGPFNYFYQSKRVITHRGAKPCRLL